MLPRCAQWCQLQRAPCGKLLKILRLFPGVCIHNAGVEGSSPSLTTIFLYALVFPSTLQYAAVRSTC